jgi:hypothetical protein
MLRFHFLRCSLWWSWIRRMKTVSPFCTCFVMLALFEMTCFSLIAGVKLFKEGGLVPFVLAFFPLPFENGLAD